ncbi:putative ammonia-lyase, Serine racemase [Helianthus annuus]|uniref:Ammonia-lyase, Serine racemase n=2 Tax=Helianthus annuus TaxID=4232 RepID=A0A9K3DYD6_HELAN|nr:serine racemase [Helianthus annuus]KAF5763293.1 putative ammonia-lyase, Serine racemase [Helianthus annuus]KAJ0830029.1 putative ammonia-lyase, Serine racemase [Helianthus annuus]
MNIYNIDGTSVIKQYANLTPAMRSTALYSLTGKTLSSKCECFKKSGGSKFRGTSKSVFSVTHSSGNHVAALALAANLQRIPAYVVHYHIVTLIVPISGGGLISGVVVGAKSRNPAIRVLVAEPKGADDAAQSKACGRLITLSHTNTIADGLRASLGDITWPIVRDLVDDIITVDDGEILEAMRYNYEVLKVAVEPSAAIGLAAVLSDNFKKNSRWNCSQNIGIVISGGNVDLGALWESLSRITRT